MGSTLIEKIIEKNTGLSKVTPGQIVTVNVDRVMIHDIFIPFVADKRWDLQNSGIQIRLF